MHTFRYRALIEPGDEAGFMLFDTVLAFDHVAHRILLIANARTNANEDLESLYRRACGRIEALDPRGVDCDVPRVQRLAIPSRARVDGRGRMGECHKRDATRSRLYFGK